uniref:RRM domain-containing protein n=1 Tax=Setaria digitata TaxID=48799 RepID=A0A915Q2F3_9BILA
MNGYYRNGPRFDRIDQDEVPESKHTVFIRGLPGHIKTDEVKDFFEDHVGPCSFDFIKLSQDQLKLFVAVRFETRDAAKECMHKYKDGDVLGYPVEMTWFRDIRRYVSYQQSQGIRPAKVPRNRGYSGRNRTSYDRSSRNDYRDDDEYDRGNKRKCVSSDDEGSKKSRSSNSSSRSPSHSQRRSSHEHTASPGSLRSRHSEKSHRSQSRASTYSAPAHERSASPAPPVPSPQIKREAIEKGETPPLPPLPPPPNTKSDDVEAKKSSPSGSQSPVERKSRKSKKGKRKRRRRSPSSSSPNSVNDHTSDELSEGELRKKILKKRKEALRDIEESLKPIVKPTLGKWEEQETETTLLQNTTLKFGLESTEDVPKRVLRDTAHQFHSAKSIPQTNIIKSDAVGLHATMSQAGGVENSFSCKKGSKESGKQVDLSKGDIAPASTMFSTDIDPFLGKREQTGSINDLKNPQTNVFSTARGQQLISFFDDASDTIQPSQGTLRLSSLTRQLNAETERERKLARLPPEVLAKYTTKKKQLEGAFKADRETFGFVTKMLIEKDPGLEDRLWLALAEAIKDMEEAFMRKMDHYLDHFVNTGNKCFTVSMEVIYSGRRKRDQFGNKRLEQLFDKYCLLFMRRLEQQIVGILVVANLFAITIKYGFKEASFRRFKEVAARWMCRKLESIMRIKGLYGLPRNLSLINIFWSAKLDGSKYRFLEIDNLECSLDYSKWLEEFMTPFFRKKDSIHREVRQHDFKQRIILIREAVLNQDWSKVGFFLGHLPSLRQNLKGVPEAYRKQLGNNLDKTSRMVFPYASTIFRTGVERFMQYNIPRDIIIKSAAELMLVLIAAERKYSNLTFDVENNSLLYVTELLIYAIANGQEQEMQDLISATSSLPPVAQKHRYSTILRAYKVLSRYEQWRLKREDNVQNKSFDLGDEIIGTLLVKLINTILNCFELSITIRSLKRKDVVSEPLASLAIIRTQFYRSVGIDVESGQESVFISVAVHYLHCVGKIDALMNALVECCHKTPIMIVDCYRALLADNMVDEANFLLDAVLPQFNSMSDPIVLDWLQPRLLNPYNYDFPEEMLRHICKLLFIFLDYGTNRRNDCAWMFLWAAVQHVRDDNLLRAQWELRKSWWPKFHRVELSEAGNDCRDRDKLTVKIGKQEANYNSRNMRTVFG